MTTLNLSSISKSKLALQPPIFSLSPPTLTPSPVPGIGSVVVSSRTTRPLWFDGRFLAASDLQREQDYFSSRQATLGRAGGFGVIHGLSVEQGTSGETLVIHAGNGVTPAGQLVMLTEDLTIQLSDLPEEEKLNEQFGLSETPQQPSRTRTGLYVIALRSVEFTANPITTYPASLAAPRVTRDGDVVEATAVALVPYPNPVNSFDTSIVQAALARQIFVLGDSGTLADSLLPLAMIGIDRDAIQWVDPYLARRDSGPPGTGTVFGANDPVTQRAFLMQYDARLQSVVASLGPNTSFAASNYFQALPAAGRFPLACIDAVHLTQAFFPQQMDVALALIPSDELPSLIEESMSLPPIDLTLPAASYANDAIFGLVPVARKDFAGLQSSLPNTKLSPALPPAVATRSLLHLLQLSGGRKLAVGPPSGSGWAAAMQGLAYGFYVRRRSEPIFADFSMPPAPATTTTPAPTTTPGPTTTVKV